MRRAFTLTEFVVTCCILGFLVVILMPPGVPGNSRNNARRSSCQANLKLIGTAFQQYAQDYDGLLPPSQTSPTTGWADSLRPYVKNRVIFQCPGIGSDPQLTDYFFNASFSTYPLKKISIPTVTVLGGDGDLNAPTNTAITTLPESWRGDENSPAFRHLGTANYLFADGHAKSIKAKNIIEKKPKVNENKYSFLP